MQHFPVGGEGVTEGIDIDLPVEFEGRKSLQYIEDALDRRWVC